MYPDTDCSILHSRDNQGSWSEKSPVVRSVGYLVLGLGMIGEIWLSQVWQLRAGSCCTERLQRQIQESSRSPLHKSSSDYRIESLYAAAQTSNLLRLGAVARAQPWQHGNSDGFVVHPITIDPVLRSTFLGIDPLACPSETIPADLAVISTANRYASRMSHRTPTRRTITEKLFGSLLEWGWTVGAAWLASVCIVRLKESHSRYEMRANSILIVFCLAAMVFGMISIFESSKKRRLLRRRARQAKWRQTERTLPPATNPFERAMRDAHKARVIR